ncbi:MAG: hypothetical protein WC058_05865 [Phycisphaeraceae bacterium]
MRLPERGAPPHHRAPPAPQWLAVLCTVFTASNSGGDDFVFTENKVIIPVSLVRVTAPGAVRLVNRLCLA